MGEDELLICDKGYVGMPKTLHPIKKPRGRQLTPEERVYNNCITDIRVVNEDAISRIKRFRCLSVAWRNDLRLHPYAFNLCAHLANMFMKRHPVVGENTLIDI